LGLRNEFVLDGFFPPHPRAVGGSAIYNQGSLSLEQLAFNQNTTFGISVFGGAIRNEGPTILVDIELASNFGDFKQAPGGAAIGNMGVSREDLFVKIRMLAWAAL